MIKIRSTATIILLFVFQSCSNENATSDPSSQKPISVIGLVYGWTNPPIDSTTCEQILPGNNSFPKLLFLNDSTFIKTIPSDCGDLGACIRYYTGKYKIEDDFLNLYFNQRVAVFHKRSEKLSSPFVELENSEFNTERLRKHMCTDLVLFEECDVEGHIMTPKSDTITKEIQFLKENRILDKLFEINMMPALRPEKI